METNYVPSNILTITCPSYKDLVRLEWGEQCTCKFSAQETLRTLSDRATLKPDTTTVRTAVQESGTAGQPKKL